MFKHSLVAPALAAALFVPVLPSFAQFATRVENYTSGTGFATEFGTGLPYTDSSTALGAPATVTPGEFGGPVTPFAAPYLKEQLVSLGVGGSLTIEFGTPIQNNALNPFGLDFLVFGSAGFMDADWPNGLADATGSIFSNNLGTTRVYVGNDPGNMFLLNPSLTPVVDGMFPRTAAATSTCRSTRRWTTRPSAIRRWRAFARSTVVPAAARASISPGRWTATTNP